MRNDGRSLRSLAIEPEDARNSLLVDGELVDPDEPISPDYFVSRYVPRGHCLLSTASSLVPRG